MIQVTGKDIFLAVAYNKGGESLGVKDTVTTKYMRQNEIFADAFNYFVYGGEQVINPESLEELDTREIDVPYGGEKGAKQPVQKTRDVIKSVIAMMDKRTAYLLLAIENQSNYPLCRCQLKIWSMMLYNMRSR